MKRLVSNEAADIACSKLNELYSQVPETAGCMQNIFEGAKCDARCCQFQNPQALYCEFTNIWKDMLKHYAIGEIVAVIQEALRNYLSDKPTKGCIFFSKETKICRCHKVRPLACREYGIAPPEEFQSRYDKLKDKYKDNKDAVIMPQCDLIKTVDGSIVTKELSDDWFAKLIEIEKGIGVPENEINDDFGGTYRTLHDHIMIYLFSENRLEAFSIARVSASPQAKEAMVQDIIGGIVRAITTIIESRDKQNGGDSTQTSQSAGGEVQRENTASDMDGQVPR